jgi:hypothetical protein
LCLPTRLIQEAAELEEYQQSEEYQRVAAEYRQSEEYQRVAAQLDSQAELEEYAQAEAEAQAKVWEDGKDAQEAVRQYVLAGEHLRIQIGYRRGERVFYHQQVPLPEVKH